MKKILLFIALSIMSTKSIFGAFPAAEQRPANQQITCCDHTKICAKSSCIAVCYAAPFYGIGAALSCVGHRAGAAGCCTLGMMALAGIFDEVRTQLKKDAMLAHNAMHRD